MHLKVHSCMCCCCFYLVRVNCVDCVCWVEPITRGLPCVYSRVPSKRVAMVSRKVFCGASSPLITGILLRVDWVLLPRRPGTELESCSDPKLGRKREVPGAHPSPWRSAPIRDTRGDSTLRPRGLWPLSTKRGASTNRGMHLCTFRRLEKNEQND